MKYFFILTLCICASGLTRGQDSTAFPQVKFGGDTLRKGRIQRWEVGRAIGRKRLEYFRDTIARKQRKFDSTLFTNIYLPSTGDYAEELRKIYQFLSQVQAITESFTKLDDIHDHMENDDSALVVLKDRISQREQTFNIRSLQMFNTVLDALDKNTSEYTRYLNKYDTTLDKVRQQITDLKKDTLMLRIFRDTTLEKAFQPQLQQLKAKWKLVDSLVSENGQEINTLMSQASAHSITIGELLYKVDSDLETVSANAFGKEGPYIWEAGTSNMNYSQDKFKQSINGEVQLARLYFSSTKKDRYWLLFIGLVFFCWIWWNFRTLKNLDKLNVVERFHFTQINSHPFAGSIIFILSLAPLFDLRAPAIYSEFIQFLLIVFLTPIFRRRLDRTLYYGWCLFIFLFLLLTMTRILSFQISFYRLMYLLVDSFSLSLGLYFLLNKRKKFGKFIFWAISFFIFFKLLAVVCNLFGRVTLSQIFGDTAVYSFAQTIGLSVFVKFVEESFLLQIQTSRIRKKYPPDFDYSPISRSIFRFVSALAMLSWLIVFTTNLNLLDSLYDLFADIFTSNRHVGSFNFTLGGILLFLGIIWLANFLQKYIAYFFGDIGDDSAIDDKGQRSRLMVTRLILLSTGFLLAVAASGLAVDRITVILGALGVGIGLGLQGIVNNFVSGIILIFDRPLRIGDTVDIGDKRGRVKEIGIRSSTLLTEEGAEVIIPNGDVLSHNIVNWTLSNNHARQTLSFTIEKPANLEDVGVNEIKEIVKKIPNVMSQRDPEILINTVNSKTVEVQVFFWGDDFNKNSLTSGQVRTAIYEYLEKKGILVE